MDRLRNFGFLLHEVSRAYVRRFERHAQDLSLSLPTCKALGYLKRFEGVSQSRLSELTAIEPMAMVRIIDRLEADGLVERRVNPSDRRARALHLTASAAPTLDTIWHLAAMTRSEALEGVSQAERDVFLSVLERVNTNLGRILDSEAEAPSKTSTRQPAR